MLRLVVDALHQGVLEGHRSALAAQRVAHAGIHQLRDRVLAVDRHQLAAQFVERRVQRDRERDVAQLAELVDPRHHARGGQGDALVGQAIAEVVAHDAHRAHDVVEVRQRLAHAHHHHVGEPALLVRDVAEVAGRDPHLADDLGGGQVAVEALGGGGAEAAVERAAHLRGHAQRAAALVGDVDRLDGVPRIHAEQPLVGAVGGGLVEHHRRRLDRGALLEPRAQRLAEVGHLLEGGGVAMVDPLHHLVRAEPLLAERIGEEMLQPLAIEVQEVLLGGGCGHWDVWVRAGACATDRTGTTRTGRADWRPPFVLPASLRAIRGRRYDQRA